MESSYINYSKIDIMAANIKKYMSVDSEEIACFIDLSIKFAMQIVHRQAIIYFMKTFEISPEIKSSVMQYAKNKDPKLLTVLMK